MFAATLRTLLNSFKTKKTPKVLDFKEVQELPLTAQDIRAVYVPICGTTVMEIFQNSKENFTMTNVCFSGSGNSKFRIIKNGVVLATLFNDKQGNVYYMHTIEFKKRDSFFVEFYNNDLVPFDMYFGFDVKKPTKKFVKKTTKR